MKKADKKDKTPKPTQAPQYTEGVDFYIEKGLFVFTEKYLLKRGFCCKNGCRHCPYGFKKNISS